MGQSTQILLVDEDTSFAAVYQAVLRQAGFSVRHAGGAQDAHAALMDQPADVVITEIMLPGRNGLRLIQDLRLRSEYVATPVIVLTVLQAADVGLYAALRESLGISHYLVKQRTQPSQLVAAVKGLAEVG